MKNVHFLSYALLPLVLGLSGCPAETGDDDDSAVDDDDDTEVAAYAGPDYQPCVTEAQCDPGSACTTVPGYAGRYCAPACDPGLGDDMCARPGLGFDTWCLDNGRCARGCEETATGCPEDLACQQVLLTEDDEAALCAGEAGGAAGFYGTCSHPNIEGTDCPARSSCYGGDLIGVTNGICLPWCDEGDCPEPDNAVDVNTICYDVGFAHPLCALLCDVDDSVCPGGQECIDIGFSGLCMPEGSVLPF